jgi:hypothetical protein
VKCDDVESVKGSFIPLWSGTILQTQSSMVLILDSELLYILELHFDVFGGPQLS